MISKHADSYNKLFCFVIILNEFWICEYIIIKKPLLDIKDRINNF